MNYNCTGGIDSTGSVHGKVGKCRWFPTKGWRSSQPTNLCLSRRNNLLPPPKNAPHTEEHPWLLWVNFLCHCSPAHSGQDSPSSLAWMQNRRPGKFLASCRDQVPAYNLKTEKITSLCRYRRAELRSHKTSLNARKSTTQNHSDGHFYVLTNSRGPCKHKTVAGEEGAN